jgi:IS30 family transposase
MKYRQITSEERYTIAALIKQKLNLSEIARHLNRPRSAVWREVHRNRCNDKRYRAAKAISRTSGRRSRSRKKSQFSPRQWRGIEQLIRKDWSPEQISGALFESGILSISHETIYRHIWLDKRRDGRLHSHLRGRIKQRRKRYGRYDSRGRLACKKHISERPTEVESRDVFGHWEIDTVMGKGSLHCIITLVERKTGWTLIGQLPDRTVKSLNRRLLKMLAKYPGCFKSITADNGTEFHGYK